MENLRKLVTGNGISFSQCGNKDFSQVDSSNRCILCAKHEDVNTEIECSNQIMTILWPIREMQDIGVDFILLCNQMTACYNENSFHRNKVFGKVSFQ